MILGRAQFVLHCLTVQLSNIGDRRNIISGFPFWLGDYEHQCMCVTKKCQRLLQTHVPSPPDILIYLLVWISGPIFFSPPTHRGSEKRKNKAVVTQYT